MRNKNPWLAGILSFIIPGLGHLYLGQRKKAIILILSNFLAIGLMLVVIGFFLWPIVWIYAMASAIKAALKTKQPIIHAA